MMKNLFFTFLLSVFAVSASAQEGRNVAEYNLNATGTGLVDGLVSSNPHAPGYDPVSVFPEGGNTALQGKKEFALDHEGVEYLFANEANMKTFLTNPDKYEPTYGGYCARAMAAGQKVHINTTLFTVIGNRSFFFVNKRAKRSFDRRADSMIKDADANWKKISGEEPRL